MCFQEYLKGKKIDPVKFLNGDPLLYEELKRVFEQLHPSSFTAQKLFLINPIRRKYQLWGAAKVRKVKPSVKPKILPKKDV